MRPYILHSLLFGALLCSMACRPEKPVAPSGPSAPVDGRQKFVGVYDVYDTLGNWRYEMEISLHPGSIIDSLYIQNWGRGFNVYVQQDANVQSDQLNFGFYFGIEDHDGNHWSLTESYDPVFMHSRLINDTLRLAYRKDNIAFYVTDGTSYFSGEFREFAVKRDWE